MTNFHESALSFEEFLLFERYRGGRPAVDPPGCRGRQIDATVASRTAEIVMPVGSVEGNTVFVDETDPGNTWQVVGIRGGTRSIHHVS